MNENFEQSNTAAQELTDVTQYCFLGICIINGLAGYAEDSTLSTAMTRTVAKAIVYILVAIVLLYATAYKKKIRTDAFVVPVYWGLVHFNSFTKQGLGLVTLLILLLYFTFEQEKTAKILSYYEKWILIMAYMGIAAYIANLLHIPLPHEYTSYYSRFNSETTRYINYHFSYLYEYVGFSRLCGLFNEPGYFGTVIALILCVEQIDLKKRANRVLLIAGILTFSVAFLVIILLYLTLRYIKNIRLVFIILLIFVGAVYFVQNIHFSNPTIELQRLKIELLLHGSTLRTTRLFDSVFERWLSMGDHYFGYGEGYMASMLQNDVAGSLSIKRILVDQGFIGLMLAYIPLLLFSLRACQGNRDAIIYVTCYFLSLYQRPTWYNSIFVMLLFAGIDSIVERQAAIEATLEGEAE